MTLSESVSVVIAGYNANEHYRECLQSLRRQTWKPREIIWVDSASPDDSASRIAQEFPEVRLERLGFNAGYRRGVNIGASRASGTTILVANQDVRFDERCLEVLVDALDDPSVGIAAPKILLHDQPELVNEAGNTFHFTGLYGSRGLGCPSSDFTVAERLATMSGCAFLIRRSLWAELGGFSDDFDAYSSGWHASFEDLDLAWRARLLGHAVLLAPESLVFHKFERKSLFPSRFASLEFGRWITVLRNYRTRTLLMLTPLLAALEVGAWLYAGARGTPWLAEKWRLASWLVRNRRRVREMRRGVQAVRRVGDRVILERATSRIDLRHLWGGGAFAAAVQWTMDAVFGLYYRALMAALRWTERSWARR